ncbi:MAG: hypothetical protein C00003105_02060 [ANME-2 cluster archaeon HR1]|jgi:hypothetical protein|nr:MAG: hypothetical protein C00003105_02060 [ANME-2 cluster archaeon HR1]
MESTTKEVMDGLFQGNLTVLEASENLGVSEDEIHNMIDDYEYVPTATEIYEIGNIIQENLNYIENDIFIPHKMTHAPFDKPTTTDVLAGGQIDFERRPSAPTDANSVTIPYPENNPYHW